MISLNLRFIALLSLCVAALSLPADPASDHKHVSTSVVHLIPSLLNHTPPNRIRGALEW
jgi:hypothetical protein